MSCFRYHKGTDFQANHNAVTAHTEACELFQIPQRYRFSSKSQHMVALERKKTSCFRYHKGTDFQANHNRTLQVQGRKKVVLDTTKVQIFTHIIQKHADKGIRENSIIYTTNMVFLK